ncbi:hypothetical protein OS493_010729 [Desmophyllum pertusum]|uniref:Uncharacterized protein n=1 Tax=Desmophyllum pertusum TaxID=174260 RepID=A0A9W9ZRT0_9CNID|nr:hypothetical protein OS493_010729 [Desmophyllum pertusum]
MAKEEYAHVCEEFDMESLDPDEIFKSQIEDHQTPFTMFHFITHMENMRNGLSEQRYRDHRRWFRKGETWGDAESNEGIPYFKWITRGEDIDLEIDNTSTHTFSQHSYIDIDINLALALDLVRYVEPSGGVREEESYYVQGDSLQIRHVHLPTLPDPTKPPHRVYDRLGFVVDDTGKDVSGAGWWQVVQNVKLARTGLVNTVLRLHSFCDWVISDINDNFAKKFGSPTRTLFVYTDVAQGQIVGSGMTDFIREVEYASKFGGRVQFEPLHLQFIPLRRNVIDVIEVQISET